MNEAVTLGDLAAVGGIALGTVVVVVLAIIGIIVSKAYSH